MANTASLIPVVLCGGTGTRLWPLSRRALPKQFLKVDSDRTMLQETVARFEGNGFASPWFLCHADHRFLVAEQVRSIGCPVGRILLEPAARGTAPAVALAAMAALREAGTDEDPLMLVTPADHVVRAAGALRDAILGAAEAARQGALVLFGIAPGGPETGYGYIHAAEPHPRFGAPVRGVKQFVEKPARNLAEAFLSKGGYFWNSGLFLFTARTYLAQLERHRPDILAACQAAMKGAHADLDFIRVDAAAFERCPADAVDTAVMERTDNAAMLPLDIDWSDVGTWSSLWQIASTRDEKDNVLRGRVVTQDTSASYLRSEGPLLATLGISDLLVVATEDAVLVAPRDRAQDLRMVVAALKDAGCEELEQNRVSYRPWGSFRCIETAQRFQVKHIVVKPGARLSMQMHHHRAEHWVVVSGTAKVTRGDDVFLLEENQSTFIPLGVRHRLENPGLIPLALIEIQSGSYLGDDDIVRFEDDFGRG